MAFAMATAWYIRRHLPFGAELEGDGTHLSTEQTSWFSHLPDFVHELCRCLWVASQSFLKTNAFR